MEKRWLAFAAGKKSSKCQVSRDGGSKNALSFSRGKHDTGHITWCEKHAPKTTVELTSCVHSGTVDRVRSWLTEASSNTKSPQQRLLILSGKSGTGKSATVRMLAQELGLPLSEWNDTFGQFQTWKDRTEEQLFVGSDSGSYVQTEKDFDIPYSSQMDHFRAFLHSGSYGSLEGLLRRPSKFARGSHRTNMGGGLHRPILLLESLPTGAGKRDADGDRAESPLEPVRAALRDFLGTTGAPLVFIFSDVAEKNESGTALDRLLSKELMQSPFIDIVEFNDVTECKS